MTKYVASFLSTVILGLFSFQVSAKDFGPAQRYNALVFDEFWALSSDVEGRLAAGGSITLNNYSVGDKLNASEAGDVLIAGGDIKFPSGRVYYGNVIAGGSVKEIGDAVRHGMAKGAKIKGGATPSVDFPSAQAYLEQLSQDLSKLKANGKVESKWGGLYLTAACDSNLQVFQLSGAQVFPAHTFEVDLSCAPADATYIFNIDGQQTGMSGMSLQSLANVADKVVFNFYEAYVVELESIGVEGSVLAPKAEVVNPQGVLRGHLFAKAWYGEMQINWVPFTGLLPESTPSKPEQCQLYPITFDYGSLPSRVGETVILYPGMDQGNFSWLSWTGGVKQSDLVNSLTSANADTYINPLDAQDRVLNRMDWISAVPGVKNSKAVRTAMDGLLNKEIIVPVWGDLQGGGANRIYQAAAFAKIAITGYKLNGKGYLTFKYLGEENCGEATVEPPVAQDQDVSTKEDQSIDFTLKATGEISGEAEFVITQAPQHGTISQQGDAITYTPNADFHGQDSLRFKLVDGDIESNEATVSISVVPVNDAPSANDQALTVAEDQSLAIILTAQDNDADTLTFTLVSQPVNGVLTGDAPTLTYTPKANFHGDDAFIFTVSDGQGQSEQATISITVTPVNDLPVAQSLELTLDEDAFIDVTLQGADIDSDSLTFSVLEDPAHGTLSGETPTLRYMPSANFNGVDSFTYRVNDGLADSAVATVTLTVRPVSDAPVLTGEPLTVTPEGLVYAYTANATDPDGDALAFHLDQAPQGMTIDTSSGQISWTPPQDYVQSVKELNSQCYVTHIGDVSTDSNGSTTSAQVNHPDLRLGSIALEAGADHVYQVSVALSNRGLADVSAPVDVSLYVGAPDNGDLLGTQRLTHLASGETARLSLGVYDYLLTDDIYVTMAVSQVVEECDIRNNQARAALVSLRVSDASDLSDTRLFAINVEDRNADPVITSETELQHQAGQTLNFQVKTTDADIGDAHHFTLVSGPEGLSIDPRTGRLIANIGDLAAGDYQIVVQVEDLRGAKTQQTLTLSIAENLPPQIVSAPVLTASTTLQYAYDVEATDPNEGDKLTYTLVNQPAGMSIQPKSGLITWLGDERYVDNRADDNGYCAADPQDLRTLDPVIKWSWPLDGESIPHDEYNQVMHTPLAVPLYDTNGDGKLNDKDDIAIIFQSFRRSGYQNAGFLRAIWAKDGTHIWTSESVRPYPLRSMAAADLDGDGTTEIVIIDITEKLSVVSHEGKLEWQANTLEQAQWGGPSIADLDQDGSPDIILGRALYDNQGNLKWLGKAPFGANPQGMNGSGPLTYVADIDLDGDMELIAGPTIYDHTGRRIITNGEGTSALGNFDSDDFPEIVNVYDGYLSLYNHDGSVIWKDKKIEGGGRGGPPVVADLDGDGVPEIGVAGKTRYGVYNAKGDVVWSQPTRDQSSGVTASSAFDFNDDGRMEIVYGDEYYLRVYDGVSGDVIYEIENVSVTAHEYPVIADIDHDDHAEIIAVSNSFFDVTNKGLHVIEDATDSWVGTRSIWNQHAYNVNNINNDLSVPVHPTKSWLDHNSFRANVFPDQPGVGQADLTVYGLRLDGGAISVTVKNRGRKPVNTAFNVNLYHLAPGGDKELLGSQSIAKLSASEALNMNFPANIDGLTGDLLAEVITDGSFPECLTNNNRVYAAIIRASVSDEAGLSDSQVYALSLQKENSAPAIVSATIIEATAGVYTDMQVSVQDVDSGDSHTFELIDPPGNVSIGRYSGLLKVKNPIEGSYFFRVRATDLSGAKAEQVVSLVVSSPDNLAPEFTSTPVTSAKHGFKYEYQAQAVDPEGDEVIYVLSRKQDGMTIDSHTGLVQWTPEERHIGVKSAEISAIDAKGAVRKQYFVIDVNWGYLLNHAPRIVSSPNGSVYVGQQYEYQVVVDDADSDTEFDYRLLASEEGMTISDTGLFTWRPSAEWAGKTARAEIEVHDRRGGYATQSLNLPVNQGANHAPAITSAPPLSAAANDSYVYVIRVVDQDGDAVSLSLSQSPNGMTLADGVITWTPSLAQVGQAHEVILRAEDARGAAFVQTFGVVVNDPLAPNTAPVIYSIPNSPARIGVEYIYEVTARDADGDTLIYQLENAPAGMTINELGAIRWTASAEQQGQYQITVIVSDSRARAVQRFTLQAVAANDANAYPVIVSRPFDQASVDREYSYQIQATDADGDTLSYGLMSGPVGMSVAADGALRWTPGADQVGIQDVVVYAEDGAGRSLQSYSINVTQKVKPLTATVVVSPEFVNPGDTLSINVFVDGGQSAPTIALWLDGVETSMGDFGQVIVNAETIGVHTIEVGVTDGVDTVIETARFAVRDAADENAPLVSLSAPTLDATITAPTEVIGSVQDANLALYKVMLSPRGQQAWQVIAQGGENVSEAKIATFDPTLLLNGQYDVVLYAEDVNGLSATANTVIAVEGDLKVGNFSITLEDLNIPVAGMPVRVTRTYDSRRRSEALDFGYGWSLGYQDVKIEESRTLGGLWALNQYKRGPFSLILDFCVEPLGAPTVTVTLPDGDVERFEVSASPRCNTYTAMEDVELAFKPVGDTASTLEALDDASGRYVNGKLVDNDTFSRALDPSRYLLTTQAGYKYYLKQGVGIEKVVDPNGHTLTYTNDGIFHSSGKAVRFTRDSQGRIVSMTDPNGNELTYSYDFNGDLEASTDPMAAQTSYTYNRSHGLLDIIDPLGRTIVKNIYDDAGRLMAQEDSEGNRTEFDHDIEGRQSVVTDRNGNTTFLYYDDHGNVTSKVDAEGHTWSYAYDDHGNQLTETNPLGYVSSATFDERNNQLTQTDALGNTASFTYNKRGQELTITDASGDAFTNVYDSIGNMLSVTDPLGNVAENTLNRDGLVEKSKDALGNETQYTYDKDGNKLTEVNALEQRTIYTYDDNGNVLSETRKRTVDGVKVDETTRYVYDARNRVIETQYADGSSTQTEYDLTGNQIVTIDAQGRRTEYEYDVYGRLLATTYPDGTSESKTYDVEGNVLTETDRLGRVTGFTYDKQNRVVRTELADGSFTSVTYDAAGQVESETDAKGNVTHYEYDAAGRRTAVINALNQRHSFVYDADGNLISETDANGHTTTYEYNILDQRVKTLFHDGSSLQETFDALDRRLSSIDQAGRVTQYGYDKLGRLIAVTDALNNVTSFTYDQAGNKLTQTDAAQGRVSAEGGQESGSAAEGRTTRWTYDTMGRVLTRTLPMGQMESFSYDVAGRLLSHTDFNGQATAYTYDVNDQVSRIDYADGEVETFTYNAMGARLTATNSLGTTSYQYDALNRLVEETQPTGAVLSYSYDKAGNKTSAIVTHQGKAETTTYLYDALNRLSKVIDPQGGETLYAYDAVGNRESVTQANGQTTAYVYDALNRLTRQTTTDAAGNVIADYRYTLHSTGRREQIEELHNGRVSTYTYDALYRLTHDVISDPVNGDYSAEYRFDNVGNRTYNIIDGVHTAYSYDDNDRLTQQGGVTYAYDANGNTLTETEDGLVTARYTYSAKNKLLAVTKAGETTSFGYNPDGIRTRKAGSGATTDFIVDQNRDYAQVLQEVVNGAKQVSYVYGDDLLSQARAGDVSYYVYDGQGSVRSLTNQTGVQTDSYHYDAFGILLHSEGDTPNSYLYTGEQYDASLDQYYLRARYYDQNQGRFTQMDTWMGVNSDPITLHKYLYANADSVNNIDPSGKFSIGQLMAGVQATGRLAAMAVVRIRSLASAAMSSGGTASGAANILARSYKFLRGIAKKCKPGKADKGNICTYAVGYVKAEAKVEFLLASTPSKWTKKNRISTIVGAFDMKTTKASAAFNLGKRAMPSNVNQKLKGKVENLGVTLGCADEDIYGTSMKFGNCAEFHAANQLLNGGAKAKRIRWTLAYYINDRTGTYTKRGGVKPYCPNCVGMFNLKNVK
ncbi:Ig-like domain-containing protein [Hahella sp. NBU794]|uniref:Ig-like domain-containing protein n=2 Tax=unclassified Hahella TaxID=2624107 RepID=UPI003D6E5EB3